jgi:PAS domain S-box-containing protein
MEHHGESRRVSKRSVVQRPTTETPAEEHGDPAALLKERTAELAKAHAALQAETAERKRAQERLQQWQEHFKEQARRRIAEAEEKSRQLAGAVAAHKRMEKALRDNMGMFKVIAEHAPDGISICELRTVQGRDRQATVKLTLAYCNDRFVEMSGCSREQLMAAEDLSKLVIAHISPEEQAENAQRRQKGLPYRGVSSWKRPDGKGNYYDWVAVPMTLQRKSCVLGIDRDITVRKRVADELQSAKEHLEARVQARTAELVQAVEALRAEVLERKRAEEERERLIAELRNALASVKTLSGMLPICASCKKIRDDKGYWDQLEKYISAHTDARFTHGICPECAQKLYPDL